MAAYEVLGTKYFVSGSGRKWHVFELAHCRTSGTEAVAGPFKTKASAVIWAIENEVIPVD